MLKTLDYVDPHLAQRIHKLEEELKRSKESKTEITNNKRLMTSTKDKLLNYQRQCEQSINKLLSQERDKLAQYLDKQTVVITKINRQNNLRGSFKPNATLNQSTRIDISTDDIKSIEMTTKTDRYRKVSGFYTNGQSTQRDGIVNFSKYGNKYRVKEKKLKSKIDKQQKLINMLVTWVKIYHERQAVNAVEGRQDLVQQNKKIRKINDQLENKCKELEKQIANIKNEFRNTSQNILETHRKFQNLREQNQGLKMERKQLLNNARSLQKKVNTQKIKN